LQRLVEAHCTNNYTPEALDAMLLSRADYVTFCTKNAGVLDFFDVIRFDEYLRGPLEVDLLAGLDSNVLLTMATVKC
jgi:hypothetical protein